MDEYNIKVREIEYGMGEMYSAYGDMLTVYSILFRISLGNM